jgi:hypothetical protein
MGSRKLAWVAAVAGVALSGASRWGSGAIMGVLGGVFWMFLEHARVVKGAARVRVAVADPCFVHGAMILAVELLVIFPSNGASYCTGGRKPKGRGWILLRPSPRGFSIVWGKERGRLLIGTDGRVQNLYDGAAQTGTVRNLYDRMKRRTKAKKLDETDETTETFRALLLGIDIDFPVC